jgi:flagellar biosynthesis chaperone FliJ
MKAYRFRLATVARIRALEERVAADSFRLSLRHLRLAQETERAARGALADLAIPTEVATMASHQWTSDQADRLATSLRLSREAVVAAELGCTEARHAWKVATQRSGVLERLHDDGFAHWREDMLRHEAAELDDLSHARLGLIGAGQ